MTSPMPDTSEDTWAGIDSPMWKALADVEAERFRQNEKWGEQHHPDVARVVDHAHYHDEAKLWKIENSRRVASDSVTWDGIFLEEVYEALAEEDLEKLRAELVQVAAVAIAWCEDIDSRSA